MKKNFENKVRELNMIYKETENEILKSYIFESLKATNQAIDIWIDLDEKKKIHKLKRKEKQEPLAVPIISEFEHSDLGKPDKDVKEYLKNVEQVIRERTKLLNNINKTNSEVALKLISYTEYSLEIILTSLVHPKENVFNEAFDLILDTLFSDEVITIADNVSEEVEQTLQVASDFKDLIDIYIEIKKALDSGNFILDEQLIFYVKEYLTAIIIWNAITRTLKF